MYVKDRVPDTSRPSPVFPGSNVLLDVLRGPLPAHPACGDFHFRVQSHAVPLSHRLGGACPLGRSIRLPKVLQAGGEVAVSVRVILKLFTFLRNYTEYIKRM